MKKTIKKILAISVLSLTGVLSACGGASSTGGTAINMNALTGPSNNGKGATNAVSVDDQQKWISNMLKIAAGVKNGEHGLNANDLSDSDFQALGITLSNYYIPFGTDVKGDFGDKNSGANKTQKLLVDNLTNNEGFRMDKSIATTIVNTTLGNIQHQSKSLHFAYCRVNPDTKKYAVNPSLLRNASVKPSWSGMPMNHCVLDSKDQTPVTYWTLLAAATGNMRSDAINMAGTDQISHNGKPSKELEDNIGASVLAGNNVQKNDTGRGITYHPDPTLTKDKGRGLANTIVAYTTGTGGPAPMFTASADASVISPSVASLMEILKRSNAGNGWGNARTTLSSKDNVVDGDVKQTLMNVGDRGKYNLQFATAPLVVSPYGDLSVDGEWTQPIVMPAANNPMIYDALDKQGNVVNDLYGGVFYSTGSYSMATDVSRLSDTVGCSANQGKISTSTRCAGIDLQGGSNPFYTNMSDSVGIDTGYLEQLIDEGRSNSAVKHGAGFTSNAWIIQSVVAGTRQDTTHVDKKWWVIPESGPQGIALASVYQDFIKAHPKSVMNYFQLYNDDTDYKSGKGGGKDEIVATTVQPWFRYRHNNGGSPYSDEGSDNNSGAVFRNNSTTPVIANDNMLFIDGMNLLKYGTNDSSDTKDPQAAVDLYNELQENQGTGKLMCSISAVFNNTVSCTGIPLDGQQSSSVNHEDFDPTAQKVPSPDGFSTSLAAPSNKVISSLFLTYTVASSPHNSNSEARLQTTSPEMQALGYKLALENLPKFDRSATFDAKGTPSVNQEQQDILDWTWYLLNPATISYKMQLLSAQISSVLLGWHNSMVGTNGVGNLMGTTKYTGFVGYTQLPDMHTLGFTTQLENIYNNSLVYILIVILLMSCIFVVTNTITIQRGVASFLIMAFMALIPFATINAVSGGVNTLSDAMFSKKMMYWGITQQQATMEGAEKAAATGNVSSYLNSLYGSSAYNNSKDVITTNSSAFAYNSQGGNDITVRWQAAKKLSSVTVKNTDGAGNKDMDDTMATLVNGAGNSAFSSQSSVVDDNDYIFRGYSDIGNYAKYIYGDMAGMGSPTKVPTVGAPDTSWWTDGGLKDNYRKMSADYQQYVKDGYINTAKDGSSIPSRYVQPFGSVIYKNGVTRYPDVSKLQPTQVVGINSNCLTGMSMASLNSYKGEDLGVTGCANSDKYGNATVDGNGASNADYGSLAAYSLMSESPFFWESWNLYDTGMSTSLGSSGSFKDMILNATHTSDPTGYFYNSKNGELKDFLDMRGMFTYFMPYARMGNKAANAYFDMYGSDVYPGISTSEGQQDQYKDNPTQLSQYYHNMNVLHAYEMYTPWVGIIDSSGYAKPTTINFNGTRYTINNPTDPAQYPKERPMVFSKSEQVTLGIKDGQLTSVERKIQSVTKSTEEDYINLLNYFTYNDGVLTTAAAMQFVFNFNRAFSENGVMGIGKGAVLYPQGFEVGNFSYDSYLRLMIMNTNKYASASYAQKSKDHTEAGYYGQVLENASLSLASGLIISDIMSMYLLPAIKLFLILGLELLFMLAIFLNSISQNQKIFRKFWGYIGKPLIITGLATLAMNFMIMLLMSNGLNSVTGGSSLTLSLGDPNITVIVICAIDLAFLVILGTQAFKTGKNIYTEAKTAGVAVVSVVQTLASAVGAGISSVFKGGGFMEGYRSKTGGSANTGNANGHYASGTGSGGSGTTRSNRSKVAVRNAHIDIDNASRRRKTARQAERAKTNRRRAEQREQEEQADKTQNSEYNGGE